MIKLTSIKKEQGNFIVTADEIGTEEHVMVIPIDAVGSRMALYGLDDPREAFDALVREHFALMSDDHANPENVEELAAQFNGLKTMKVKGVTDQRDEVLIACAPQIMAAFSARTENE